MATNKKIAQSRSTSFTSALHAQFHDTVRKRITTKLTLSNLNIPQVLYDSYGRNIDIEIEINKAARAEAETGKLLELDKTRDDIGRYFLATQRNAAKSPVAAQRAAGDVLEIPLSPYRTIFDEAFDVETLHIKGLIADMRKPEYAPAVTTLGLTDVLAELDTANLAYESASNTRSDNRIARTVDNSKTARPRTDSDYYQICDLINASYLLSTDATMKADIGALIDQVNMIISEYKTTARQMGSMPAAKRPGTKPGGDEEPDPLPEPTPDPDENPDIL